MKKITYVTTNDVKFQRAASIAASLGIELVRAEMEFDEMQVNDGEKIARFKAEQAFHELNTPVMVTDDTWDITGLNGFPGAYMKQVNGWFTPEDWLHLTQPLKDRQITLIQHLVYQDEQDQKYFVDQVPGTLLTEARGNSKYPSLTITSFDGGKRSYAEDVAAGIESTTMSGSVWHQLAEWLASR